MEFPPSASVSNISEADHSERSGGGGGGELDVAVIMKVHSAAVIDRLAGDCAIDVRAALNGDGGIGRVHDHIAAGPAGNFHRPRSGIVDLKIVGDPAGIGDASTGKVNRRGGA